MNSLNLSNKITSAQVVLSCRKLEPSLNFFVDQLGFTVNSIHPADAPTTAVISGHGIFLRLEEDGQQSHVVLRLLLDDKDQRLTTNEAITAPNGVRIEFATNQSAIKLPPLNPQFLVQHYSADASWHTGRAGMEYRDLIPGRQGGRIIASHIRIPNGGPVPDYVHYHRIRFQMIFCRRGWVRVVYEDQGEPFILHAGDCVLQPPEIRHRVLECSDGLEVVEIGSPAEHETHADPELELPTDHYRPERLFGQQAFVRHQAASATYSPWLQTGYQYRDTGIAQATNTLAEVRVIRPGDETIQESNPPAMIKHTGEAQFFFALDGNIRLQLEDGTTHQLNCGDAITIPAGLAYRWAEPSTDLELLEVLMTGNDV